MIRYIVLGFAFVSATAALLFSLGAGKPTDPAPELVSRATPGPLTFQPATNIAIDNAQVAPVEAASFEPLALPEPTPLPEPAVAEPVVSSLAPAVQPATPEPKEEVMDVLRVMSYGIVEELKKPVPTTAPQATPQATAQPTSVLENQILAAKQALAAPAATPAPEPAGRTYVVQEGDSLPGISFRMYGTTSAYYQILQANPDVISSPSEMQAGMVLRIPDLP
ncbi:MAG: LysM peptidoglycan-binding domain-containing protein [Pelagimonas sp.]|jgi:phage tail protein X|nr:LysM peptidoglycan-binding domain-containing protein [Pelagimonas sp.]